MTLGLSPFSLSLNYLRVFMRLCLDCTTFWVLTLHLYIPMLLHLTLYGFLQEGAPYVTSCLATLLIFPCSVVCHLT